MITHDLKHYINAINDDLLKRYGYTISNKTITTVLIWHLKSIVLTHYKYKNVETRIKGYLSIKPKHKPQ